MLVLLEPCRFEGRLPHGSVLDTTGVVEPVGHEHPEQVVNGPDLDKESTGAGS